MIAGALSMLFSSNGSGYGSGNEITLSNLNMTDVNYLRDGSSYNFTVNVPKDYFCAWAIQCQLLDGTNYLIASGSGLNIPFTADFDLETAGFSSLPDGVKYYDIVLVAGKGNKIFPRHFRGIIAVYPAKFLKAAANEIWDISTGGVTYHAGGGTDRQSYKIFVTASNVDGGTGFGYNGSGYIGMERYRSSVGRLPVHLMFDPDVIVSMQTTAAYIMRINFDCQNLIIDGSANPSTPYGFRGKFTGGFKAQAFMIEPVDPASGSTLSTAGKNITVSGIQIDGAEISSAGFNIQLDKTAHATFSENYSFDRCNMTTTRAFNTGDELYYLGHFNDDPVGGFKTSKITRMRFAYNYGSNGGNDGFQLGRFNDSEVYCNYCVGVGRKNTAAHRNMLQLIAANNVRVYRNFFDNRAGGTCNTLNIGTGRTGGRIDMWANIMVNANQSSHTNNFFLIQENEGTDAMTFNFYNNLVMAYFENLNEIWNATLSPVINSSFNPFRSVDNVFINLNDADQNVYVNSPNTSGYVFSNYFAQNTTSQGFVDWAGGDYRPASLGSAMFRSRTAFTKTHPCANQDYAGYQYVQDIAGPHSGVYLQV